MRRGSNMRNIFCDIIIIIMGNVAAAVVVVVAVTIGGLIMHTLRCFIRWDFLIWVILVYDSRTWWKSCVNVCNGYTIDG